MKKSELWKVYVARNPIFATNRNVTLSAAGIRKLFDQKCDIAYHEGEPEEQKYPGDKNFAVEDLMNIFGMK